MTESYFPLIIAHRGASKDAYENSFEAFQLAIDQNADMIELDVHLTKDGHHIVFHDPVIKNIQKQLQISSSTLEEIQAFKLPNGEKIPMLKDVLNKFHSKIRFNIELKCSIEREAFDNLLKETGINTSETVISSFLHEVHMELKETDLEYELAYLYVFPSFQNKSVAQNDFIKAMNPYHQFISKKAVKMYHDLGKKVFAWTIDDERSIKKLIKKRVDGIITNKPKETREIVKAVLTQ